MLITSRKNRLANQRTSPVVSAPTFAIRRRASAVFPLEQYVTDGLMTPEHKEILCQAIGDHQNVLVVGGTGSGKTTLANALIAEIMRQYPGERLLIIEDTAEIQCSASNAINYRTSPEITMSRLLRTTLRMRPDRVIVGEVRGPEALDLLMSWNLGHPGGLGTLHANDARAALSRLMMLISMHPESPEPIEPLIGEAVDLIVHIARAEGGRRVREMLEVLGHDRSGYQLREL